MKRTPARTAPDRAPAARRRAPVLLLLCGPAAAIACLSACDVTVVGQHSRTVSYAVSAPVRALVVHDDTGSIHVTRGASGLRVTERQGYRGKTAPHTTHAVAAGTLTLAHTCRDCSVSYDVQLPAGTSVDLRTDTGSVVLDGLSGPVDAATDTGSVTATGLTGGRARLTTGTGSVNAAFGRPPATLDATADTGSVTLTLPSAPAYAVTAGSGTGHVSVGVRRDDSARYRVTAHTDTGDVAIRRG
ncbi:DUF4097 family beta strand repeat-containing protein [Streptomyces sp. SL13]|uniref:DUF4097 family beta strand repeat-containing protein n=1 Tax=Streptantibioticus silvisoli TaxID=2705255 RepID=A0AA90HBN2_9ACTN|nr:DUF4097 family beta strand repeat-containing protein [Streptantibioticus silvisoli]MDI5965054.1 DUF4097 family beta strand repeat-containing protein [Streptantibioticus silvisoli]MDI5971827.1 DUF4097 family beta strand repeat-containing protein [Streptantibioticus silvisoli]